ncbi:GNAT family N-acetyltransferase [Pannonibacter sp. Pt2-lr]|uniref:GNAT family N-acetyltransferase n=1 Tax=Pannonibacter anstelovis TaxID=3121537 RepID=A0ABU7ZV33_9HYPH
MLPSLSLRRARLSDAPEMTQILHRAKASWGYPAAVMDAFRAEQRISPATITSQLLIVAEREGRMAAFAGGEMRQDHFYLGFLFVAPEHQGQGLGRLLLSAIEDLSRDQEIYRILLESDPHAAPFYRHLGYRTLSERPSTMAPDQPIPMMEHTFEPQFLPLTSIAMHMSRSQGWSFEAREAKAIAAHWQELTSANPNLWNGRKLHTLQVKHDKGHLTARCAEVNYASFLAWRDWGAPDRAAYNLFGSAIVRSSDGALLYGIMGPKTANHGACYPPAGNLDLSDLRPDGSVDVEGSIARELLEETGLDINTARKGTLFALFDGQRICIGQELTFDAAAEELRTRMLAHAATDPEEELEDIVILRQAEDLKAYRSPGYAKAIARSLLPKS